MRAMRPRKYNYASKPAIERARTLRRVSTETESLIWRRLRANAFGARFRRQHPFAGYFLDFYSHEAKLVIEIDGGQHFEPDQQARDAERTRVLEAAGLHVLRFTNREVAQELDAVLERIWEEMNRRMPSP